MRLLTEEQVLRSLDWQALIGALDRAYRSLASDPESFTAPQRLLIEKGHATYLTMPCVDEEGWYGTKMVSVVPDNPHRDLPAVQAFYVLFDQVGSPVLAAEATTFTYLRTAAVSALAARYLAPEATRTLLLVGTGGLAPWMVEAHSQVRDFERVLVWGRRDSAVSSTIARLKKRPLRLSGTASIERATDIRQAVAEADVITMATTSNHPLLPNQALRPGQHVDAVGAFTPEMCEVPPATLLAGDVWVDDLPSARAKAGDLLNAERHGWAFAAVCGDLPHLVSSSVQLRRLRATIFKSVGTAVSDLTFARQLQSTL